VIPHNLIKLNEKLLFALIFQFIDVNNFVLLSFHLDDIIFTKSTLGLALHLIVLESAFKVCQTMQRTITWAS